MKRKLLIACAIICAIVIASTSNQSAHSSVNGAATGYTGSPLEFSGRTCGSGGGCHSGGVTDQTGWITSDIPTCGYTPGQTYNITVFATSPGRTKFGFSCSPQFPSSSTAGTMIAATGMILSGSGRYITHNAAGTPQNGTNSRTWTFQWVAPAAGSGSLTFYAAMNATNSNSSTSGDIIYKSSLLVNENIPLAIQNSGSISFCITNPVTLTSSISSNNAWTLNGNPIGSGNSVTASASGNYALINTNGACVKNASVALTAAAGIITPVITNLSSDLILCPSETANLTATGTGITWQPGNVSGNAIAVSAAGTYSASSTNACGTGTSNPLVFIAKTLPTSPEVISGENFRLCPNATIELAALSNDDIVWSPGNETTATISVNVSGPYSATATNECGSSEPTENNVIDMALPNTPVIDANGPTDFCEGDEVVLSVSNFSFDDAVLWQPDNISSFEITANTTETYSVQYTNMCGSSDVIEIDVNVESAPATPIITLTSGGLLDAGMNANLFTWYLDGIQILDEQDPTLTPSAVGMYTVQAFSDLNCPSELSAEFNYNPTLLNEIDKATIQVYPNPSNGVIYINSSFEAGQLLQVFDLSGKMVFEVVVSSVKNTPIELPLQSGLYILSSPSGKSRIVISK